MKFSLADEMTMSLTKMIMILLYVQLESAKSMMVRNDDSKVRLSNFDGEELAVGSTFTGLSENSFFKTSPYTQTSSDSIWGKPTAVRGANLLASSRTRLASKNGAASRQLSQLLSTGTLSMADPFRYLIRETNKLNTWEIDELEVQLLSRLENDEIPESLMPHARALQSIIRGVIAALTLKRYTRGIRNDHYRSTTPSEISSPPALAAYGLFSPDVFDDPDSPVRLLIKLIQIPKEDIPKVSILLKNYIENSRKSSYSTRAWLWYTGYAEKIISYLQEDRILDDLRRDMAEIRRTSTFAGSESTPEPDTASSNPTEVQQLSKSEDLPKINNASGQLSNFLSLKTLSYSNPFHYLIRETSQLPEWELKNLDVELQSRLESNRIPDNSKPYARALQSIIRGHKELLESKLNIQNMQYDRSEVPDEVKSPPALSKYDLFSSFVFSDPIPPNQLLNRLLRIPRNEIPNVISLLQNFTKISTGEKWRTAPVEWWRYILHAETLVQFLQNDILDDLKRNMVKIQHLATPDRNKTKTRHV